MLAACGCSLESCRLLAQTIKRWFSTQRFLTFFHSSRCLWLPHVFDVVSSAASTPSTTTSTTYIFQQQQYFKLCWRWRWCCGWSRVGRGHACRTERHGVYLFFPAFFWCCCCECCCGVYFFFFFICASTAGQREKSVSFP